MLLVYVGLYLFFFASRCRGVGKRGKNDRDSSPAFQTKTIQVTGALAGSLLGALTSARSLWRLLWALNLATCCLRARL